MLTKLTAPLRPGHEAERELAARLWSAQRTLGDAMRDLATYCERGGDLHGGDDDVEWLDADTGRVMRTLRDLALRLDRTVAKERA